MQSKLPLYLLTCFLALLPSVKAGKPPATGAASDSEVRIESKPYLDRAAMTTLLGADPGENIVIIAIKLIPAEGKKIDVQLDDFLLRSDKDGQKGNPLQPSQIAGSTVMVISSKGGSQGTGMSEQRQTGWGIPGMGGGGLPGTGTPVAGAATADTSLADASIEERGTKGKNVLLDALKSKVLKEGETGELVEGLLYFVMEGKQKQKDLELLYRRQPPKLSMRYPKK